MASSGRRPGSRCGSAEGSWQHLKFNNIHVDICMDFIWRHISVITCQIISWFVRSLCRLVRSVCWLVRSLCWLVRSLCWLVGSQILIFMLTCQIFMMTCQVFMLTCQTVWQVMAEICHHTFQFISTLITIKSLTFPDDVESHAETGFGWWLGGCHAIARQCCQRHDTVVVGIVWGLNLREVQIPARRHEEMFVQYR